MNRAARLNARHNAGPMRATHTQHRFTAHALLTLIVCSLVLPTPCLAQRARRSARSPIVLTSDRVDASPGRRLLIPVVSAVGAGAPAQLEARLDDGRTLDAELVRLQTSDRPDTLRGAPSWLPRARQWFAMAPGDPRIDLNTPGSWFVLLHPPEDSAGQGLWIGGRRVDIAWLPDPYTLRETGDPLEAWSPWASPSPEPWRADAGFRSLIEEDRLSPARQWRWKLAVGQLAPTEPFGGHGAPAPIDSPDELQRALTRAPLADRALRAFSEQLEARWQVALASLHRADPTTARRVRARLAGAADLSPGPIVPIFAPLDTFTDDLLDDLLDPRETDAQRSAIARAWLGAQPRAVAWVIDDAGRSDALTDAARPTIGIVSLPDDDQPRALNLGGAAQRVTVESVPPRIAAGARPDMDPQTGTGVVGVNVELGAWSTSLGVASGALPVTPPGLTIGPLRRAWSMESWRDGRLDIDASAPSDSLCAAMLHRAGADWRLYVECKLPPGSSPSGELVRVWIGPFSAPSSVLAVTSDGRVNPELGGSGPAWTDVGLGDDRWSFDLDLPAGAVGANGVLRLAIEHIDTFGERTSAPRRMLPWQREPGRLAIDTRAWEALGPTTER